LKNYFVIVILWPLQPTLGISLELASWKCWEIIFSTNAGKLCSQYSNKMCGQLSSGSLHEKVTAWLACMPTRLLIDLSAECLAKLIGKQQHYP
jgi:hypothetical protein